MRAYPTLEVKVAKLVPDKPLKPIDTSENLGIHFNTGGECVPHSILGTVEEYLKEAAARGEPVQMPPQTSENSDVLKADFYLKPTKVKCVTPTDNGHNALRNWEFRMLERKNIQTNISSKK